VDLLGLGESAPVAVTPSAASASVAPRAAEAEEKTDAKVVLSPENADGMGVALAYVLSGSQIHLELMIANRSSIALDSFALQLNTNIVGLKLAAPLQVSSVAPGQSTVARVPLLLNAASSPFLQVALKNNVKIYYFQDLIPFRFIFSADGSALPPPPAFLGGFSPSVRKQATGEDGVPRAVERDAR
jgi:hypothetical protein